MLSSNNGLQEKNDIERWQACAGTEAEDDVGIVARLLQACIDSIAHLLLSAEPSSACKQLRRSLARMKLWAHGHNAWNGGLDSTLEKSKSLRDTTLSILNPLCRILSNDLYKHTDSEDTATMQLYTHTAQIYSQTKWLLKKAEEGVSESDSDSDSPSNERTSGGMERLAEEVKIHVQCLFDLNNALEYPAIDPEPTDEPSFLKIEQRAAHDYHKDLIVAKFPKVHIELAECLGRISWDRYQRMQEEREISARNPTGRAVGEEEMAALGHKSRFADSEFQDSGLGTSLPAPQSRYAETVISFMTSITGGKRVQIPPLPAEARAGAQFECNACGRHIRAATNRDWRKHLYLDLQPYTCLYSGCMFSAKPFADRQLWSQHLELDHELGPGWDSVTCPLCLEATDAGKSKILIHFARHMEDIALAALPREVESDNEAENETDDASRRTASSVILSTAGDKAENKQDLTHMERGDTGVERTNKPIRFSMSFDETVPGQSMELEKAGEQGDPTLSKLLTKPSINPDKVHSLWASTGSSSCRCKVWELKNKDWFDRGTGYANVIKNDAQWNLVVYSEDQGLRKLVQTPISMDGGYSIQQDILMVWTEPDGTDMALSFETPEGCHKVWDVINEVHRTPIAQNLALAPDRSHISLAVGAEAPIADPEITASHQEKQQLYLRPLIAQKQALQQNQLQQNEVILAAKSAQQTLNQILQKSPGLIDATDEQPYPRNIIPDDIKPYIPPQVLTWGDIKQWAIPNEEMIRMDELLRLQEMQYLKKEQKQDRSAPGQSQEADTIKCICGYSDDDGNTVLCELCNSWQHIVCYYETSSHVPDVHECVDCNPRPIDQEVAARVQRLRREHSLGNIRNEEEARRAARKIEIERRCQQIEPPIPPQLLRHMESFKASIKIAHPLDDKAWATLEPRLVAQLAAAKKRAMRTIPTSASNRLQTWLTENMSNPYPSRDTKLTLAQECGITEKQVSTWFTNARARKLDKSSDKLITSAKWRDKRERKSIDVKLHRCHCGRSYTRSGDLRRHQENHAQEEALVCGVCSKVFYIQDLLERHIETHEHPGSITVSSSTSSSPSVDLAVTEYYRDISSKATMPPAATLLGDVNEHPKERIWNPNYQPEPALHEKHTDGYVNLRSQHPEVQQGIAIERQKGSDVVEAQDQTSCDACRQRRVICDRWAPRCSPCSSLSVVCTYTGPTQSRPLEDGKKALDEQADDDSEVGKIGESDANTREKSEEPEGLSVSSDLQPPRYPCLFPPCTYSSKRESSCKQHMEYTHGWEYVRTENDANDQVPGTTTDMSGDFKKIRARLRSFSAEARSMTADCAPQLSLIEGKTKHTAGHQKNRAVTQRRATMTCEACHVSQAVCDKMQPHCSRCTRYEKACVYAENRLLAPKANVQGLPNFLSTDRFNDHTLDGDERTPGHTMDQIEDDHDLPVGPYMADIETQQHSVPKFERIYMDIAADNFYDPSSDLSLPQPSSSRPRDGANAYVQRALQAAQHARSQESLASTTTHESPYKQGSPYSRAGFIPLQHGSIPSEVESKAMAPKDAILDIENHGADRGVERTSGIALEKRNRGRAGSTSIDDKETESTEKLHNGVNQNSPVQIAADRPVLQQHRGNQARRQQLMGIHQDDREPQPREGC